MLDSVAKEITQELFQLLKQFSRLKWEKKDFQGLKRSEFEFLVILELMLREGKKGVTPSDLSNQMQITPAGITHLVNPLEEAGYIERLQDPNDRRVVLVGLTPMGKALAETLLGEAHESLVGVVDHLGEDESRTLIRLMSSMIAYLETLADRNSEWTSKQIEGSFEPDD
jgi:DNA-binding MarR family transcriptional regulator